MRLRLIAPFAGALALLLIALAPLVSTTQAQQSDANYLNLSTFKNPGPCKAPGAPDGGYNDILTGYYPGNPLSKFWPSATLPILGLNPIAPIAEDDPALCWKQTYTRGVGSVPGQCSAGQDKDAGLCYPKCRDGFKGVGPVCWQSCPSGYRNDGALWYPKCKAGFVAAGCCICSPACPSGMTDIGVSCQKDSYGRGVGKIPGCGSGLELDAGLCYPQAAQGFVGVGPVAWGKCPPEFPFNCGAGCAKNQAACATAVTDMTLNTVGVAVNILSFVAGGPGVTAAAKKAAKTAVFASSNGYGYALWRSTDGLARHTAQALKLNAKVFAKEFVITFAKNKITNPRNASLLGASLLKTGGLTAANHAAKEFGGLKTSDEFDWTILTALDPTGISSMVTAFTKYSNCSQESFLADVNEIDFGTVGKPVSDVKVVTLSMQQPTTITEITTTPFTGASISAETDCVGKLLQPGQKCALKVSVSGQGKIEGGVQVYTTEYDVIPFVIDVKANPNAAPAPLVAGVDDAVNITAVVGIWAWGKNQSQKVTVKADGTAESWAGHKGVIKVKDPIKRVYEFNWDGGKNIDTLTLSEDRQELSGRNIARNIQVSAIRRPWDARCKPGETYFAGLCYDIPPDYAPTTPGFMGKPCPLGWRDDGTRCWPNWTGVDVPAQASQTGTFKHPILVTDCFNYSQSEMSRQFQKHGRPGGLHLRGASDLERGEVYRRDNTQIRKTRSKCEGCCRLPARPNHQLSKTQ
jgi:hypothetical protein